MREILFRGKRIGSGEFVFGDLSIHKTGKGFIKSGSALHSFEVDLSTVGQYTGLTDKNGKKIFEGDVAATTNPNCRIWFVDYKPTAFCANQANANYSCVLDDFFASYDVEVIGNVHDNPELLK